MPGGLPGIAAVSTIDRPGQAPPAAQLLCRGRLDLGGLRKLGDLAVLVVDEQEQVEIADRRRRAGALDDRLLPRLVMRALRRCKRRPDIDAGAGLAVQLKQEVFAQQLLLGLPTRNDLASVLGDLRAGLPLGRIELDQFQDQVVAPSSRAAASM